MEDGEQENCYKMSTGLFVESYEDIQKTLDDTLSMGYNFIITKLVKKDFGREPLNSADNLIIGVSDIQLTSTQWYNYVISEITSHDGIECDGEIGQRSRSLLEKELYFANHIGVTAVILALKSYNNIQLAQSLNQILSKVYSNIWINIPMYSGENENQPHSWEWWNQIRTLCDYNRKLDLVLDLCNTEHTISTKEINRWIGEPVRAIVIPTSFFVINQRSNPVLSKTHQEIIKKFLPFQVKFIIKNEGEDYNLPLYHRYMQFLRRKFCCKSNTDQYFQDCEDLIQHPLQPLTENLEAGTYEIFETDKTKYIIYQKAVVEAMKMFPEDSTVVIMVAGAGRGPLVDGVLNVSQNLNRKVKIYAIEKNPYAINTLEHRVKQEWKNNVILVHSDVRYYNPPEKADILLSELLGSFGDNELSPECLDGAEKFLKEAGISIPSCYTSYLAPVHNVKIYDEIRRYRLPNKSLLSCYETPYVVHLSNSYQIAPPQELFTFSHPNRNTIKCNRRYKKLRFESEQNCILTGFVGYFTANLYKNITISTNPLTHTPNMFSWFPIVFSLPKPIRINKNTIIEISFWRMDSKDRVWYEWCLHSPVQTEIFNSDGRSYSISKH